MNPYLLSEQLCMTRGKGDYYQELGIKVPRKSVTNPYKLYLMDNSNSVTNKTLVYEDKDKNKTEMKLVKKENNEKVEILISTPNISFIVIRFMLFFGFFNYGKRGILAFVERGGIMNEGDKIEII